MTKANAPFWMAIATLFVTTIILVVQFFVFDDSMSHTSLATGIFFSCWLFPIIGLLWALLRKFMPLTDDVSGENPVAKFEACRGSIPEILVL